MKKVMRAGTYFAFRRVLLAETELNDMKTNRRIALATLGALCMLSSCSLDDKMAVPTPVWEGEFKVQMINGSTGETEDHVGDIFVYFFLVRESGILCWAIYFHMEYFRHNIPYRCLCSILLL